MTILDVARLLGVSLDLLKAILARALKKKLKKRRLSHVRYIAIDEFGVRKGHKYMTVVLDLQSGAILHAQEGKAVGAVFGSKVPLVFDPYHVVCTANRAIDEIRRDLDRQLDAAGRKAINGSRFLLLRGLENLSEESVERLTRLFELNEPLSKAYILKEELRDFWNRENRTIAERHIGGWIKETRASGLPHFIKLTYTIERHLEVLLSFYSHHITTGPLEGLNNKIKVLKRRAYSLRNMEFFKLRIYFLHESRETITAFAG